MKEQKKILILDNNKRDYAIISNMISNTYKCIHITSEEYSIDDIKTHSPICILLNYESLDFQKLNPLKSLKIYGILSKTSVILLSNKSEYQIPKECAKYKISDYILKNNTTEKELLKTIKNSLNKLDLRKQIMNLNNKLSSSLKIDDLTGLINRSCLIEKIKEEIERTNRNIEELSVAIFDIDFFSAINNSYNYNTGDEVLKEVSNILKKTVRKTDIISRYGDDEFVILFINKRENSNKIENQAEVCKKIQKKIFEYNFNLPEFKHKIYTSVGITPFFSYLKIEDFLNLADRALNFAKTHGKGNIAICYNEETFALYNQKECE